MKKIILLLILFALTFAQVPPAYAQNKTSYASTALRVADYLLSQQNADGAIPDAPGAGIVNEDSNLEYALMGLAAAYRYSGDPRYLLGLERGIHWLAAREDMTATRWRGSWRYAYSATPPYAPVAISPGPGLTDVRGVDATSALFVYLLYLHKRVSGSGALVTLYEPNARAALDFILANNQSPDGFFYSSWQRSASDGKWRLWKFRYTADQADVYLGMRAGWLLYRDARYSTSATLLKSQTPTKFFLASQKRYALGLEVDGTRDPSLEGFNGIFPQGYAPWVFGAHANNTLAYQWLKKCARTDGSLACYAGDPRYSLSVDVFALAAKSLGQPRPNASLNWLTSTAIDSTDGGVRDTRDPSSEKFSNVAGFTIMAFLGFSTLLP